MVKADNVIEIEINGERNESLHFAPLQRRIRGNFDLNRVAEPLSRLKASEWPRPIPGERLELNPETGEASIIDGIHGDPAVKAKIERNGYRVPPERENFQGVDVPTWLYWIKRAVASGVARVVKGRLPDDIGGEPRTHFIVKPPAKSSNERLAEAIEQNTAVLAELLKRLVK